MAKSSQKAGIALFGAALVATIVLFYWFLTTT